MECSNFIEDYADSDSPLCRCPICKGFLPRHFPDDKPFTCKKCGTELMTFPVVDEEGFTMVGCGKICPLSSRDTHAKRTEETP